MCAAQEPSDLRSSTVVYFDPRKVLRYDLNFFILFSDYMHDLDPELE